MAALSLPRLLSALLVGTHAAWAHMGLLGAGQFCGGNRGMGIDGKNIQYNMNQAICIPAPGGLDSPVKQENIKRATQGLSSLLEASNCELKVNLKSQLCYQKKLISKILKAPSYKVMMNGNTVVISDEDDIDAMVVIEKYNVKRVEKKKPNNIAKFFDKEPTYGATFNMIGQPIAKEGVPPKIVTPDTPCKECLEKLHDTGGDAECDCDNDMLVPIMVSDRASKYSSARAR